MHLVTILVRIVPSLFAKVAITTAPTAFRLLVPVATSVMIPRIVMTFLTIITVLIMTILLTLAVPLPVIITLVVIKFSSSTSRRQIIISHLMCSIVIEAVMIFTIITLSLATTFYLSVRVDPQIDASHFIIRLGVITIAIQRNFLLKCALLIVPDTLSVRAAPLHRRCTFYNT